ncbi:NifU family protein [Mycoplasma sp. P36-A1]|uniref:NifU family protein n=1 Tax=Mycoplasma sp. P36-A1 TaxID=3252900 RepID=UPI003C2E3776
MKTIEQQINEFTETIRPYLRRDGGDFEVVKFEDGIVYIKMLGQCAGCGSSAVTLMSIEEMMVEEIPGIVAVKEV